MVNARFDRVEGYFLSAVNAAVSSHRRVAGFGPNGRTILQRTHTSAVDFEVGPFSPGIAPAGFRR